MAVRLGRDRGWLGEARAAAAVAIWGFLHGVAALEGAKLFGVGLPADAVDGGLAALLRGLASEPAPAGDRG